MKERERERGRGGQRLYGGTTEIEAASGGKDNKRREARIEPSPANEQDTVDTRERATEIRTEEEEEEEEG